MRRERRGRQRRERNIRPLPQSMDGANSTTGQIVQSVTGFKREQAQYLVKKVPGVVDSARDRSPVAHDDKSRILSIYAQQHRRDPGCSCEHTHGGNSRHLRTPTELHIPPCHPTRTPLGQVLTLGNESLVNGTGQQGDAVPADLVSKVLAGHEDRPFSGTERLQKNADPQTTHRARCPSLAA